MQVELHSLYLSTFLYSLYSLLYSNNNFGFVVVYKNFFLFLLLHTEWSIESGRLSSKFNISIYKRSTLSFRSSSPLTIYISFYNTIIILTRKVYCDDEIHSLFSSNSATHNIATLSNRLKLGGHKIDIIRDSEIVTKESFMRFLVIVHREWIEVNGSSFIFFRSLSLLASNMNMNFLFTLYEFGYYTLNLHR